MFSACFHSLVPSRDWDQGCDSSREFALYVVGPEFHPQHNVLLSSSQKDPQTLSHKYPEYLLGLASKHKAKVVFSKKLDTGSNFCEEKEHYSMFSVPS